jgi:hypothetical protein
MLSTTTALFDADGPFASVYLDSTSDQGRPVERLDLRWKNARKELEQAGADDATLDAIEGAVHRNHGGGSTLAVIASGGEVRLARHLPEPPAADACRFGPFPWLGPIIEAEQGMIPHVVVLADRVGADVYAVTASGDTLSEAVDGDTENIQRSQPGGWSQRRFQQRSENTWDANARLAGETVAKLADQIRARAVLVGGDERAVGFLNDSLPAHVAGLIRPLEGAARNAGVSVDDVAEEITRLVDTVEAEETVQLLEEFREEKGQADRAADGPEMVVKALQAAVVRVLLVHDDPADDRTAWFGPEPGHLALDRDDLVSGMGVEEPFEGHLIDGCIRAAVATGADVRVVPSAVVTKGVGAVLRRTDIDAQVLSAGR